MRRTHKIGPKSRTQSKFKQNTRADLGDTDTSTTEENFASPAEVENQTDYGLDFTSSHLHRSPAATTRSRMQGSPAAATRSRVNINAGQLGTSTSSKVATRNTANKRKQKKPQHVRFFQEYRKLCARTDFMIPRLPFSRVVREILMAQCSTVTHITLTALEALQVSSEMYLTQRLQDSYMLSLHRGRVTLTVRDMELMSYLRGPGGT